MLFCAGRGGVEGHARKSDILYRRNRGGEVTPLRSPKYQGAQAVTVNSEHRRSGEPVSSPARVIFAEGMRTRAERRHARQRKVAYAKRCIRQNEGSWMPRESPAQEHRRAPASGPTTWTSTARTASARRRSTSNCQRQAYVAASRLSNRRRTGRRVATVRR